MNKIYYKIVTATLGSIMLENPSHSTSYGVQYEVGKFVEGIDGSPLFVFSNLESAYWFLSVNTKPGALIYEVEVEGIVKMKYITFCDVIADFWERKKARKKPRERIEPPKNTVFVKKVKLLKEVDVVRSTIYL